MPPTARPLVEKYFGAIPRGPVNNVAAGRGADARRAQDDGDEGQCRDDQRVALLAGAGPARSATGRARRRRLGARRPRQLAPRRGAGPQREDRDLGHRPASTPSSGSAFSPSRRRSSRASIRRWSKSGSTSWSADFIAKGPTEDEVRRAAVSEVARPDPRARAGRRLRRQGGRRWPRGRPMPATANGMRRTSPPMPRSPRPRSARRCSNG